MFGVSFTEIVVVFIVALVLFGPDELPRLARTFGKIMGEVRKNTDSLRREFYNSVYPPAEELKREFEGERKALRALKNEVLAPPPNRPPPPSQPLGGTPLPAEAPASHDSAPPAAPPPSEKE